MVVIALGVKIMAYMDLVPSIDGHYHYILEIMWTLNNGTTDTKTYTVCGKENMESATSLLSILSYPAATMSVTWDVTSTWYIPTMTTPQTPVI